MGYWGWRPLILGLFMSTWVAGCNVVTDHASPSTLPTTYPSVTLTVGRLASPRAAPTRAAVTTVVSPAGLPLAYDNPICYETREHSRLCLGLIFNPLPYAVTGVVLEVQLSNLLEQVALEQALIPAGGFAPYQASFETRTATSGSARLIAATRSTDDAWVSLLTEGVAAEALGDGRYSVTALVRNVDELSAEALRAVVTLLDDQDRLVGYRVVDLTSIPLESGGQFPLRVLVAPQIAVADVQISIYVEGRRVLPD